MQELKKKKKKLGGRRRSSGRKEAGTGQTARAAAARPLSQRLFPHADGPYPALLFAANYQPFIGLPDKGVPSVFTKPQSREHAHSGDLSPPRSAACLLACMHACMPLFRSLPLSLCLSLFVGSRPGRRNMPFKQGPSYSASCGHFIIPLRK